MLGKVTWTRNQCCLLIVGHEGAEVVVAKGENVRNFQIGDYAGIKWLNSTCNSCDFCEESHEANCPYQKKFWL